MVVLLANGELARQPPTIQIGNYLVRGHKTPKSVYIYRKVRLDLRKAAPFLRKRLDLRKAAIFLKKKRRSWEQTNMGRPPCCDENGLKKGPWTSEEDQKLVKYIQKHGHGSWRALPKLSGIYGSMTLQSHLCLSFSLSLSQSESTLCFFTGLNRCGKSCRLRWTNYLRPDIKRGKFSQDEEQTILNLHAVLGNK